MKKISGKIIASIIILNLVIGLCFNVFFFKPKTAKATDGGGGIMNFIKEMGLDSVASNVADLMMTKLEQNIFDWGMGRKSKINLPFSISDMKDYLDEALNQATGKVIEELRLTKLCEPIAFSFGNRLKATFKVQNQDRPKYETYAGCTLNTVINNVTAFIKRPRITLFGWDAWNALTTPKNNVFGSFFLAQDLKIEFEKKGVENAKQKATQNQGYKDEKETAESNKEKGIQTCAEKYPNTGPVDVSSPDLTECLAICGVDVASSTCILLHPFEYEYCEDWRLRCLTTTPACIPGADDATATATDEQTTYELYQECLEDVEKQPEITIQEIIKNPGASIAELMKNALKIKSDKLGVTDEITELVGIFFQALINKATTTGLQALSAATQQATLAQRSRVVNKDTYGYLKSYTKTNTTKKKKDARSKLVAGMDKSVKQLTRAIINCGEKEVMHLEEFAKNINGILESNVEALYVGIQGINLKSDAVILDPPYAPYSVYGYSWGEVFPSKVPDTCREILNQMNLTTSTNCTDIVSGLEPIFGQTTTVDVDPVACSDGADNDGDGLIDFPVDPGCSSVIDTSEINTSVGDSIDEIYEDYTKVIPVLDLIPGFGENNCLPCMYDHDSLNCPPAPLPPQPYPGTSFLGIGSTGTVWTTDILELKQEHYNGCHEWYDITLDRCEECTKAYDSKCSRLKTEELRYRCLERYCNNYAEISDYVIDPPISPFNFYNKCLIEEQKSACFACLMENFVPSTYCEQTKDYIARMIIKYPAIVKLVRTGDNKGQFLGLFDQTIADMGGECDDNYDKKNISLALICRILPEFSFNGVKRCRTDCFKAGMTTAQLLDITDFRPDENDCGNIKLDVGGKEPFFAMDDGILESRGICCADFWQRSRKQYATCIGAGPTAGEPDTSTISNFACTLTADPISGLAPLSGVDLTINATGLYPGNEMTYRFDCNNDGTIERTITNTTSAETFSTTVTDLCNYPENNIDYTAAATVINEFGNSISCRTIVQTTDCEISSVLDPESGVIPVSTDITGRLHNAETGSFTFTFYCDVPINGGPLSTWSGATSPYDSNTNQYTLDDACNFTVAGTKGIGVSILNNTTGTTSSCYQRINVADRPTISCVTNSLIEGEPITISQPVELITELYPNSAYLEFVHSISGTTLSYNCDGRLSATQTISSTAPLGTYERTLYCNFTEGEHSVSIDVLGTDSITELPVTGTCETIINVAPSETYW